MANSKQAKKRVKQNEKRRAHNASRKSEMRTFVKKVVKAIQQKNIEVAKAEYINASSILDKLAGKGMIHKNKAARHKSRLIAHIKKLEAA